jgi:signal transduction histidine kinase
MERSDRIAVVGAVDERLIGDLRQLPLRPEVRAWRSLGAEGESVLRFEPTLVVVTLPDEPGEEIGALRLLRQLWPALGVVVATEAARETAAAAAAGKLGASMLVWPCGPGALAAALEHARHRSDRPRVESFLDLAHGLADEINNPLLFASGWLQLLQAMPDAPAADRRDQLQSALDGLARIAASVERLRALSHAAEGPQRRADVDLAELLREELARRPRTPGNARVVAPAGAPAVVGDREQLRSAVATLLQFADELAGAEATVSLRLDAEPGRARLRLVAHGGMLAHWRLPQSFEPYYPTRALRGQNAGLGMLLAQTVVLAHGGQAQARRLPDGGLQFDFVLPA